MPRFLHAKSDFRFARTLGYHGRVRTCRLHITGASGAGVTTLGRALSDSLAIPHHDTDDFYWLPTANPYTQKRAIPVRLRLIRELFLDRAEWVLSGSLDGWGDPLVPFFDLVVFVRAPTEVRLRRLRAREARRFGPGAVEPGGWRHQDTEAFIAWASLYDEGDRTVRSLARHGAWLEGLPCPVFRIDGTRPVGESVNRVLSEVGRAR